MRLVSALLLAAACTPSTPSSPRDAGVPRRLALPRPPAPSPKAVPSAAEREADRRRRAALLPAPSADLRRLLADPRLPAAPPAHVRPDPTLDWIVDLPIPATDGNGPAARAACAAAPLARWGAHAWGRTADGSWRALEDDAAPRYDTLAVAVQLVVPVHEEDLRTVSALSLHSLLDELRVHPILGATPEPRTTPEAATDAAAALVKLEAAGDLAVSLLLVAPPGQPFDPRAVWDVLTSLGLTFSDGDVFAWPLGDSPGFTVDTTTPPGYFDPIAIAAGRWHPGELRFETHLWRARAPLAAVDALERAFGYAQKRLGGRRAAGLIQGDDHDPYVPAVARRRIQAAAEALTRAGIAPGSPEAARLFGALR